MAVIESKLAASRSLLLKSMCQRKMWQRSINSAFLSEQMAPWTCSDIGSFSKGNPDGKHQLREYNQCVSIANRYESPVSLVHWDHLCWCIQCNPRHRMWKLLEESCGISSWYVCHSSCPMHVGEMLHLYSECLKPCLFGVKLHFFKQNLSVPIFWSTINNDN